MEVKCIEKGKDILRIELSGKNHLTLANAINEDLWQQTGVIAAFSKKHPQIDNTEIIVQASSPKTKLLSAAEKLAKDAESLKKQVK